MPVHLQGICQALHRFTRNCQQVSIKAIKTCDLMIMHDPHELELTSLMSKTLIHEPHTIHHFDVIF